ncbi:MAG: protein kinase, partial [Vicinamibacterales bacterium]
MSLVAGTRLGPYEIQSAIGAGGMGEVYKARDTRLDRTVAIKILPGELSADPDRRNRFEREARAIAALNHPHICTLHDIGTHDGTTFLVMEHLPGQTLADRLLKGPVPLAQALDIAAQIADALDAAHKHGIIHRDLKPGNVMLTSSGAGRSGVTTAKLLDFGLAKLAAHGERPAIASQTHMPTKAAPATAQGTILGTLQYMAPEQLEGKEADARTDLWALGAIVYEMLTGRRAFEGESQVSLIGNIMNAEPPALATTQPLTPPALDRVVTKCLAKHPDGRWDTAHDVADELRWIGHVISTGTVPGARVPRALFLRLALVGAGALAVFSAGAGLMWLLRPPAPSAPPVHVSLDVRPAEELNAGGETPAFVFTPAGSRTAFTWTPDGQALVFVGRRDGVQQLYLRRLDAAEARPLAGTEGAQVPAVSRDGQWVAFWAGGAIRKVPFGGGPVTDLAPGIAAPPQGLAWDASGQLWFSHGGDGGDRRIWRIPGDGKPTAVTTVGDAEVRHVLPAPLPGGTAVLFTVRKRQWSW